MKLLLLFLFLSSAAKAESTHEDRYPFLAEQARIFQQLARSQDVERSREKPHMISEVADLSCLDPKPEARGIVRFMGQTNLAEKNAAEKVVNNLRFILGRNADLLKDVGFSFVQTLPLRRDGGCLPGHQYADGGRTLTFARRCPANSRQGAMQLPTDKATITHELGHLVANRGGFYPKYNRAVPGACRISGYCTHSSAGNAHRNRNEEFAEVFAAFVVAPARLKAACPSAYRFMKTQVYLGDTANFCQKRAEKTKTVAANPHEIQRCVR